MLTARIFETTCNTSMIVAATVLALSFVCCIAAPLRGGHGGAQRGGALLSASEKEAVPLVSVSRARASVFSEMNVPSSVTDDFFSCARTGDDFQTKCKLFLRDARFFPTVASGAANFTFGSAGRVSADGWCSEAWAQMKNCLNGSAPLASPHSEPCDWFLRTALANLQPLAAPAYFPDLNKPIGPAASGGRKKVSLIFWSGAFVESKNWAESSNGELWVQDGTLEGRLLGMVAAFKWPESEDRDANGNSHVYPHCETDMSGLGWTARHTLEPWKVASAMFAERLKVSDTATALLGSFSPTNVFAKTEVAVITGKLATANVGATHPLLSLKLLRSLKVDGVLIPDRDACAKVLATVCSAAHGKLKGMTGANALPVRCEAGCAVNTAGGNHVPACDPSTVVNATASAFSDRCASGFGAASANSHWL